METGEWRLGYLPADNLPGASLTFGRLASGIYTLTKPDLKFADMEVGDVAMPGEDGIRMGRDYRRAATVTFELGVDGVDGPVDRHWPTRPWLDGSVGGWTSMEATLAAVHKAGQGPEQWCADGIDMLRQVWDADAVRGRAGRAAWLMHTRAGRTRQLYGRPRKFDIADERFASQGYTSVACDFVSLDDRFYDSTEKREEMWEYHWPTLPSRPGRPSSGPNRPSAAGKKSVTIVQEGSKSTFPVIVIHGPCKNPAVTLPRLWSVQVNLTIADGEYVTIDPRPWARTVTHTKGSSTVGAGDKLTRSSARLAQMTIPPGRWAASMSYGAISSVHLAGPRIEIRWRDAFAGW
ncbi:hypothetical protein ABZV65_31020 [Streptomyces bauhiniae]|uniref:hypothetical protein n=1 Tax=Streptomyces bauhiniae TaxID=2340725 RepID=UPI0033B95A72